MLGYPQNFFYQLNLFLLCSVQGCHYVYKENYQLTLGKYIIQVFFCKDLKLWLYPILYMRYLDFFDFLNFNFKGPIIEPKIFEGR